MGLNLVSLLRVKIDLFFTLPPILGCEQSLQIRLISEDNFY